MTILSFMVIFAGMGLSQASRDSAAATTLVTGVFRGSILWWLLLGGIVSLLRRRLGPGVLIWVNRISGLVLLGFGLRILIGLL